MSFLDTDNALAGIHEAKRDAVFANQNKNASSEPVSSVNYEDDGLHGGLEFPTEEERFTLRRVSDKLPWAAYRRFLLLNIPSILL